MVETLDHLALKLDLLARLVHEWPLGSASCKECVPNSFISSLSQGAEAIAKPTRCFNTSRVVGPDVCSTDSDDRGTTVEACLGGEAHRQDSFGQHAGYRFMPCLRSYCRSSE